MDSQTRRNGGCNGKGRSSRPDSGRVAHSKNSSNGTNGSHQGVPLSSNSQRNASRQAPEAPRPPKGATDSQSGPSGRPQYVKRMAIPPSASASNIGSTSGSPALPRTLTQIGKGMPMQRPDHGGSSCIGSLDLLVNQFLVKYDERTVIFYYLIKFEPDKFGDDIPTSAVSNLNSLSIKKELFKSKPQLFPSSAVAYDGEKNLYSIVRLQSGQFKVHIHRQTYIASIEFKKEIALSQLAELPARQEILQALNVIVKEASSWQRIVFRRSLYSKIINPAYDLGRGIAALEGSQQTLGLTEHGLVLHLNYTVMPCRKSEPVLQFLRKHLGLSFNKNTELTEQQKLDVKNALTGLRVVVTHRVCNQRFKVTGVTHLIAEKITFEDEKSKKMLSLVDYYMRKHKKEIRFKRLPCLDLSEDTMNYVPIEFCSLAEGQWYPKENLNKQESRKLREITSTPKKRKEKILEMINASDGPCRGEMANQFHISVTKDMTQVTGRVLRRPDLKLSNSKGKSCRYKILKDDCRWDFNRNKLRKAQKIEHWAILDFSASPATKQQEPLQTSSFIKNLVNGCRDLGIQIQDKPLFVQESAMAVLSEYQLLYEQLDKAKQSPEGHAVQLLICAMSDRDPGYKSLKLICDTELGIMTQCCLSFYANNTDKKDQYFANLALKINAKLGGSNVELFEGLPRMEDGNFMFIGADVNHPPSSNKTSPSITAVVATINCPQSNNYAARVRTQAHREERIIHLGDMCKELIDTYARCNGAKPGKIIYFRDGVSDGQFDMVLNKEIRDLKEAIESDNYAPSITVVVAQKRHHTRLFPKDDEAPYSTRTGNVPPGTVVDTDIVDPMTFNFYLCSHYGSLGTSKPTHYHVLHDDHNFTSDELQGLIYNLCFTFARCNKPVSLVPPVYYADLAAYRGRLYYEGLQEVRSPTSSTSSVLLSSSSSSSAPASCDHCVLPKAHWNVADRMYYV